MRVFGSIGRLARAIVPAAGTVAMAALIAATAAPVKAAGPGTVLVLDANGPIDGVLAEYLSQGVAQAARDGDAAVVVKLNTPGGDLVAMQTITGAFLESSVPVIVWVTPAGGWAASAGTFVTLAANLSYMAPGTRIGAASPIDSSGADIPGTLGLKIKNDSIASIMSIAQARGRSAAAVAWAASTVRDAISSPATEAVSLGAVDGIAATLDDVLRAASGHTVTVSGGRQVTLALAGLATDSAPMNPFQALLHLLDDPNLAFILLLVGLAGLGFEFVHPNFLSGIAGGVALILAAFAFGSLPLNITGLALVVLGVALLLMEIAIPSHGALTIGGAICITLGAATLYTQPAGPLGPPTEVALPIIVVTAALTLGFGILITLVAVRTRNLRRSPVLVGSLKVVGTEGIVAHPLDPLGSVTAAGEEWSARSAGPSPLPRGTPIRVIGQEGLVLIVEPVASPGAVTA